MRVHVFYLCVYLHVHENRGLDTKACIFILHFQSKFVQRIFVQPATRNDQPRDPMQTLLS